MTSQIETARQKRYCINDKLGNWKNIGAGHIRGYPGLVHTALAITEYIPKCKIYAEPFAGLGRTARHIQTEKMILNDKSDYAYNYLNTHFYSAVVSNLDFEQIFRIYDGPETIFLIDPPWSRIEYVKGCKNRAFCDRTPKEYYDCIIKLLPKLQGVWFLCGNKNNSRLLDEKYYHKLFQSKRKIMGGNISTLVMSNESFVRHHQDILLQ